MRHITMAVIMQFAFVMLFLTTLSTSAESAGGIYFSPSETTIFEADTFDVQISIDADVVGLHCFRLHLNFDRENLSLLQVTEGPLMPSGGNTFFFAKDTVGIYDIFDCIYNPPEGAVDGSGVLVNLTFTTGETPCSSPLELTYVLAQDVNLDSLPVSISNGEVVVDGCCSCPFQGDLNADGAPDAVDLNAIIDVLFFGGLDIQDPSCPNTRTDFDISGHSDAVDLNLCIDYLFFGGPEPLDPCAVVIPGESP